MKKNNLIYYIATFVVFFFILTFDVLAYCPLGPDVTKDLYNVLKVMKILAPLLCVVLSTYDAIRAVTKGDPATDMKAVAKKFGKRMIYTILLFFIPVLIDICFQMADVWDANGTCNLSNPEGNNAEENNPSNSLTPSENNDDNVNCYAFTSRATCLSFSKCDWLGGRVAGMRDFTYYHEDTGTWESSTVDYLGTLPDLCIFVEQTIDNQTVNCNNITDDNLCNNKKDSSGNQVCWWDYSSWADDLPRCHHDWISSQRYPYLSTADSCSNYKSPELCTQRGCNWSENSCKSK